ncbi:MAG TPA: VWA domain-containing protein [Miltoncostaea sp.]|nr:VWA domain-containing protein [Miltoncostaea sp.]
MAASLRAAGVPVGTGRILSFAEAARHVAPRDLYWAAQATLVSRREDLDALDRAFQEAFGMTVPEPPHQPVADRMKHVLAPSDVTVSGGAQEGDALANLASPIESLRRKDFAACTPDEIRMLGRLMTRLRLRAPERRTRRRRPARAGDPDLRRTLRRAMRTGGEPIDRAWRRRRRQRRRLLLVLDVSGSMSTYSRALAMFAHAALHSGPDWEAFAFGTRLTRMTRALAAADPDAAFAAAAAEVSDWDGGTRIGASIKRLCDEWGRTRVVRGSVCVILSDGLDVGDPELLGEQMARLGRLAHHVIWLNPLKGGEGYAPLARGMAAALPHVDVFRPGHNLQSLEEVADVIARL